MLVEYYFIIISPDLGGFIIEGSVLSIKSRLTWESAGIPEIVTRTP